MEKKAKSKEEQCQDSISQSSSITSDSSNENFDIRLFPLPKPSLSASEAQKQRETHQAYTSSQSGYDPNRIPFSVFSSKPANSTDWSLASNESLFSIYIGNFDISTKEDYGLDETRRYGEESVQEITDVNPVKKLTEPENETIKYDKKPDSKIDNEIQEEEIIETKTEKPEDKVVEKLKDNTKPVGSISTVSHSPSISCRSDKSNNSISSFVFPTMQKEEGIETTPTMEIKENVSRKRRPEYFLPPSPMQPSQPSQPQSYSESGFPPKSQPQLESRPQSPKAPKNGWFPCFHCPSKRWFFK